MDWEVAGQGGSSSEGSAPEPKAPKRKGGKLKKWVIVAAVIAVVVAVVKVQSCVKNQPKSLSWPTTGLATMLPDPPTKKGEVNGDSDSRFSADIDKCSESQYKEYVEACKEKSFTVDADNSTSSYEAYNNDGYKLHLYYSSTSEEMSITLEAPIAMGTLTWPSSGAGSYAPTPSSKKGKIDSDSSTYFYAYVGDTDATGYSTYVDACISAGFDVDYHRSDANFYADNAAGAHISVESVGYNTMTVRVDASKVTSTAAETPAAETKSSSSANSSEAEAQAEETSAATESADSGAASTSSAGSSDLRQFTDEYEAFMNSYCDFMEKYNSSSNTVSMMADYAKMMKDYTDWTAKAASYDFSDASVDDLAYYNAANERILERLSKLQ